MLDSNQQRKIIRRVATKAREFLFQNRNKLFAGTAPHLSGLCGYASSLLHYNLTKEGLEPEIVQGSGHWFVKCGVWLVDVTASQFGQGKICIRNYNRVQEIIENQTRAFHFWQPFKMSRNPSDLGLGQNIGFIEQKTGIKLGA